MLKRILCIVFFMLLPVHTLMARLMPDQESQAHTLSLGINSDAFTGMEVGYGQNPGVLQKNDVRIYARFSFPLLLAVKEKSFNSWELNLGANAEVFTAGNFGTIADMRFFLIHHHQILGTFMPLGVNLRLTPAYCFSSGYLGFQINWNQTIATHISHSQYVKNTFTDLNADDTNPMNIHPRNGWYGNTGSHFGFGIESGWEMGSRYFLYGDIGLFTFSSPYTGLFDAMMMGQVPFYYNMRLFYKM